MNVHDCVRIDWNTMHYFYYGIITGFRGNSFEIQFVTGHERKLHVQCQNCKGTDKIERLLYF